MAAMLVLVLFFVALIGFVAVGEKLCIKYGIIEEEDL